MNSCPRDPEYFAVGPVRTATGDWVALVLTCCEVCLPSVLGYLVAESAAFEGGGAEVVMHADLDQYDDVMAELRETEAEVCVPVAV